jgi:hypothetical protein
VGACSKHYLGYGGGGEAQERELMEEILLPHEAMIRLTGSVAVMPGYHDVHGTRCVANSFFEIKNHENEKIAITTKCNTNYISQYNSFGRNLSHEKQVPAKNFNC